MSGITFLSENLGDDATLSLSTGTANAQFPLDNLKLDTTTKKFRSVGNSVVIVADLLQTRPIDSFGIVGDATGNFGVTAVSIKTSVTLDFSSSTAIPVTLSATENLGYEFFTQVSHRYVEITLTGTGSYAEVSKIFIGEKINLSDMSLSIDSFKYGRKDQSKVKSNDFGQKFITTRNKIKMLSGSFEFATLTEHETLDDMFTRHGVSLPLWIILDPNSDAMNDGQFKLGMYGYMDDMPDWGASGGQQYNAPIKMSEVI